MTAIKYVFAKDAADLAKIQAKAVKAVNSARVQVQIAAVATIKHAHDHGDWTFAQKLIESLGSAVNGAALVEWFVRFGGLTIAEDGKGFSGWKGKQYIADNFTKAKEKMWYDLKKPNPFKGYSLEEALQKVIKDHAKVTGQLKDMAEEDKAKVSVTVNDATIQAVLKLCNFQAIFEADNAANQDAA